MTINVHLLGVSVCLSDLALNGPDLIIFYRNFTAAQRHLEEGSILVFYSSWRRKTTISHGDSGQNKWQIHRTLALMKVGHWTPGQVQMRRQLPRTRWMDGTARVRLFVLVSEGRVIKSHMFAPKLYYRPQEFRLTIIIMCIPLPNRLSAGFCCCCCGCLCPGDWLGDDLFNSPCNDDNEEGPLSATAQGRLLLLFWLLHAATVSHLDLVAGCSCCCCWCCPANTVAGEWNIFE